MRAVQAALDALPAEQRVVVALFSVDGLSHGEIAAILGVPEGTVWSRLHKGRKALAAALK
jgi:RNA polymerase sigma-70 factor (ECF subfamily)